MADRDRDVTTDLLRQRIDYGRRGGGNVAASGPDL